MSEKEADKEERSFWDIVCNFFKGIGLKVKLILGAVLGIFGFISIFLLRKNMNSKAILELELKKVREEVEIELAQEEIDRNDEKILTLEKRIEELKAEIKEAEKYEPRENVSEEDLDEFFDDRGF